MAMPRCESEDMETPVIEAIRAGDRYAFSEFLGRNSGWVRGVVFGVLGDRDYVDDAVQQVWTAAWLRIGELRDASRWRSWLYRLARNAAIDFGRAATRRRKRFQSLDSGAPEPGAAPSSPSKSTPSRGEMLAAITALPALYREPFVLRHLSGWSYREIGNVMGLPVDTVETRLVRARRLLREALKGKAE